MASLVPTKPCCGDGGLFYIQGLPRGQYSSLNEMNALRQVPHTFPLLVSPTSLCHTLLSRLGICLATEDISVCISYSTADQMKSFKLKTEVSRFVP